MGEFATSQNDPPLALPSTDALSEEATCSQTADGELQWGAVQCRMPDSMEVASTTASGC